MGKYHIPGVAFETVDLPQRVVRPVRSDITGFVGVAERGPLHEAIKIESWEQFVSWFGGCMEQGYLAYAVQGYFSNGGRTCFVVRVGDPSGQVCARTVLSNIAGRPVLLLTARDGGPSGERIRAQVSWPPVTNRPERFTLTLSIEDEATEAWSDLTLDDPADPRYAVKVLNHSKRGSRLVLLEDLHAPAPRRPAATPGPGRPASIGGAASAGPKRLERPFGFGPTSVLAGLKPEHFSGEHAPAGQKWGLRVLADIDQVSLVAAPDIVWQPPKPIATVQPPPRCDAPPGTPQPTVRLPLPDVRVKFEQSDIDALRGVLMQHCESLGDRFALIDSDLGAEPNDVLKQALAPRSSYAALYYPWLLVSDPLQDDGSVRAVPSSGHVAGVCARVDLSVGVQKPPANEVFNGVQGVARLVGEADLGDLNDGRVNVIRALPGRGIRVYGARTLARDNQPDWLFVNVRRLIIMIETAINSQTQWAVFQPNNTPQRLALARVVSIFLDHLWRQGYLDGASAADAYSVICDDTTNPPQDVDRGQMTCQVRVMAPAPAEFVVVRIGKTDGAQSADRVPEGADV